MASAEAGPHVRCSLTTKLGFAVAAFTAALLLFLVFGLGPSITASLRERDAAIVSETSAAMRELASNQVEQSRRVLLDLIDHTTDVRRRELDDLPVALFAGDVAKLRAAVATQDRLRSERLLHNVQILATEMQRRAETRIEQQVADLSADQLRAGRAFAEELRASHVWLSIGVLLGLVGLLGAGLYALVVRPVGGLRAATRQVARGDLTVAVAGTSGDEIGALAADFATMLGELQASRAALTRLNRELEAQVARKTAELVEAAKMSALGRLAAGLAHEFHNLIGGIRGCATELLRSPLTPEQQETLGVILRAGERATTITRHLRSGTRTLDTSRRVDLAVVLRDALRLAAPEARRLSVRLVEEIGAGAGTQADADALHEVFVNLLGNALQAMPRGGTLTVRLGRRDGQLEIAVADTGVGIAPEHQERVFEPFFSTKDAGSGLGLWVAHGIVTAHGGTLTVASREGEGSTFTLRLPCASGAGPA